MFDFDGTLAELHLDFALMKSRLASLAEHFLGELEQPPLRVLEWLEVLRAEVDRRIPHRRGAFVDQADRLVQEMELDAACRGSLFPFTRSMLRDLQLQGIKAAVITRNCEEAVRLVFPDIDHYCGGFLARDHVPRVKPDPDHLLRVLERLACDVEGALMVGDHPLDIETGRAAGAFTAGVASGRISREELARAGADWVASDCSALMEQLGIRTPR